MKILLGLLTAIAALLLVGLVIATISIVADWYDALTDDDVRLSFRSFWKFYGIAPEQYECYRRSVHYRDNPCHWYRIVMKTPLDHARYILWRHGEKRRASAAKGAKVAQKYLDCVRKDIERFTDGDTESNSQ